MKLISEVDLTKIVCTNKWVIAWDHPLYNRIVDAVETAKKIGDKNLKHYAILWYLLLNPFKKEVKYLTHTPFENITQRKSYIEVEVPYSIELMGRHWDLHHYCFLNFASRYELPNQDEDWDSIGNRLVFDWPEP